MDTAVVGLLIVVVGMLTLVLFVLTRNRSSGSRSAPRALVSDGAEHESTTATPVDAPLVDVIRLPDGGFQVNARSSGETMLEVHPISTPQPDSSEVGAERCTGERCPTCWIERHRNRRRCELSRWHQARGDVHAEGAEDARQRHGHVDANGARTGLRRREHDDRPRFGARNRRQVSGSKPNSDAGGWSHCRSGSRSALSNPGGSRSHREAARGTDRSSSR